MSRIWKWILGIILGLVILAVVGFMVASFFGYGPLSFRGGPVYYGHPMMGGYGNRGLPDDFRGFRPPMMGRRGFGGYGFIGLPFFFLGGLLRLVFPLALLALVAFFSYRAGKNAGTRAAQVPPAPVAPAPEPEKTE